MALYHMVSTQVLLQGTVEHNTTHLGFALVLVFLTALEGRGKRSRRIYLTVLVLCSIVVLGYIRVFSRELQLRAWFNTVPDLIIGAALVLLVLEATRQTFGWLVPLLAVLVVIYPFFGSLLPEPFHTTSYGLKRTISNLSVSLNNGIYGEVLSVSANFIFLFVVFGGVLQATGATKFFIELGKLIGRGLRGGPGLTAVVSSAAVGSVTGNIAANITITGSFTIPLMKKTGYTPEQAAAIEAAASNGGQIMPPVMGIVAFGMAGMTGIPYVRIMAMAVVPAFLYFYCVGTYVQLNARKLGLKRYSEEVDLKAMLSAAPRFLVPLGVIVAMLVKGYTVWYVAFWAIVSAVLASLSVCVLKREKPPPVSEYLEGFVKGAKSGAQIAAMSGCIGLILATITMSGLGVKLSSGIEVWSGGRLLPALCIVGGICVFMGMGGPSLTAYIIASLFAVPALMTMGVGFEQAHFFTMFATIFAYLTPPVAIGAVIASKLAGGGYTKTAVEAVKAAAAGFLLPLLFIYCPVLLLLPQRPIAAAAGVSAGMLMLFSLQVALTGYFLTECRFTDRVLALLSFVFFLIYFPLQRYILFASGVIIFIILIFRQVQAVRKGRHLLSKDNAGA
ncbi:MAG: TRAP transporter fused permease subunit [Spirochaetes bacterium]|nr:TRAP transporter fused permease subunit [Spirochaetota bacterium]